VGADEYLGISVGWADVYARNLSGQWIDVTGLADGQYWLESEIDPFNLLDETDDTNNITRVLVDLVVPEPLIMPGDYNQDDAVNAADYVLWRKTLGQDVARGTGADGDGNGTIEAADLAVWQAEYGTTRSGSGGAVPEPTTGSILLMLSVWLLVQRRRK
jgi:hypothetical protein